jgi:hypothetical protein
VGGEHVLAWLGAHGTALEAPFVYKAWLEASGADGAALVREHVLAWLGAHGTGLEAGFVFPAWLEAAGADGVALVREHVLAWLAFHGRREEASFVLCAWLDQGGEYNAVASTLAEWMGAHGEGRNAAFVARSLAKRTDLPPEGIRLVVDWCRAHPEDQAALAALSGLGKRLWQAGLEEEALSAAEGALGARLRTGSALSRRDGERAAFVLSFLATSRAHQRGDRRERVNELLRKALLRQEVFAASARPHPLLQRAVLPERVAVLAAQGKLEGEQEAVERLLGWVGQWAPETQTQACRAVAELQAWLQERNGSGGT